MELSRNPVGATRDWWGLGRCRHFFWLGVVWDTVGVAVLFTGVFANLDFYDTLLYLGSIIIFLSLLLWVSWYTGNIELLPEEALKGSRRAPSASVVASLLRSVSHRCSLSFGNFSASFLRIPRRRFRSRPQRTLPRTASLVMTVTGQVEEQLGQEDKDKESGDPQDFCKENRGAKPEDDKSSEAVGSSDPEAGPSWVGQRRWAHLVLPGFPPSPLDKPLPSAVLASESLPVVPLVCTSQPLAIFTSRSQPVISVASTSQPPVTLASTTQLAVPMTSESHPQVPVASESHPLVLVASKNHIQVPLASRSQLQNLPGAPQTQPPPVLASGTQTLATQVPLDPQVSHAVQDLQDLLPTQQAAQSTSLVQEIFLSQSLHVLQTPSQPVAQAFETSPLPSQELSQELPDNVSPVPEAAAATEAQQSVSSESTPASMAVKKIHSL